jgi:hypothetical protein
MWGRPGGSSASTRARRCSVRLERRSPATTGPTSRSSSRLWSGRSCPSPRTRCSSPSPTTSSCTGCSNWSRQRPRRWWYCLVHRAGLLPMGQPGDVPRRRRAGPRDRGGQSGLGRPARAATSAMAEPRPAVRRRGVRSVPRRRPQPAAELPARVPPPGQRRPGARHIPADRVQLRARTGARFVTGQTLTAGAALPPGAMAGAGGVRSADRWREHGPDRGGRGGGPVPVVGRVKSCR